MTENNFIYDWIRNKIIFRENSKIKKEIIWWGKYLNILKIF